jgi:hypothetical protein
MFNYLNDDMKRQITFGWRIWYLIEILFSRIKFFSLKDFDLNVKWESYKFQRCETHNLKASTLSLGNPQKILTILM